jgi:ribulose 1,5-bisphosphate synthetase/thiazole synthase
MMWQRTAFFLATLFLIHSLSIAHDLIVYSATPAGIAAAITAARTSSTIRIAIIEPTPYIGGMAVAGGIGLGDLGVEETSKSFSTLFKILKNVSTVSYYICVISYWYCRIRLGTKQQ